MFVFEIEGVGIAGVTPLGWVTLGITVSATAVVLWRSVRGWRRHPDELSLAWLLALIDWTLALSLFTVQSSPLQVIELLWFGSLVHGSLVLAVGSLVTSVVGPQRLLRQLVEQRTRLLNEAREETAFYLNIWGHKVGNLLQGITTYLELIREDAASATGTGVPHGYVSALIREATLINRQVSVLVRLVNEEAPLLSPVDLLEAMSVAVETVREAMDCPELRVSALDSLSPTTVIADECLSAALANLLVYIVRTSDCHTPDVSLQPDDSAHTLTIEMTYAGPPMAEDVRRSLFDRLRPTKTTLNLDLYIVKLLVSRYGGSFEYSADAGGSTNRFRVVLRTPGPNTGVRPGADTVLSRH